jgi:hypothetical protein
MNISSRTPEGDPNRCPVCGVDSRLDPSRPPGDAPCPACGCLLWFPPASVRSSPVLTATTAGFEPNGELLPESGDPIPLLRPQLRVGRRESCDICLPFANVSSLHCEFVFTDGCWTIQDLKSTNGVKVNGVRVTDAVLYPGDRISIAKRTYTIRYTPPVIAAS